MTRVVFLSCLGLEFSTCDPRSLGGGTLVRISWNKIHLTFVARGYYYYYYYYYYYSLLHHTSQKKAITKGEGEKPGVEVLVCAWVCACACVCARVRTHMYIYMQGRVYNCSEAIP